MTETSRQRRGTQLAERGMALASQLRDLRAELDRVIAATLDANSDDEHDPEGSTIAFERAQLVTVIASVEAELAATARARTRLELGQDDRCEVCGEPIDPERLLARPATRRCVGCAARASR